MNTYTWRYGVGSLLAVTLLSGCGESSQLSADAEIATRVAVERAVAATLTAAAIQQPTTVAAAPTSEPAINATAVPQPATPLPDAPATDAPLADVTTPLVDLPPSTQAPLPTDPSPVPTVPTDAPTAPEVAMVDLPPDGQVVGLEGNLVLRSAESPVPRPVVIHDVLLFQVNIHDPDVGTQDGAGIKNVAFSISQAGQEVYSRTEMNAHYCPFGDDGDNTPCKAWVFSEHQNQWPNGTPINNEEYTVQISIAANNPDKSAFWTFSFTIA